MWTHLNGAHGTTNTVVCPTTGPVSFNIPEGVTLTAFVNDVERPIHHVHLNAGDRLYFKTESKDSIPKSVSITYDGQTHNLPVHQTVSASEAPASQVAASSKEKSKKKRKSRKRSKSKKHSKKETIMTGKEDINIFGAMPGMGNTGLGTGLGAGLLGGVLGGALLGGRRGLFGDGDGVGVGNVERAIDTNVILSQLGDLKAAVPLAEAQTQIALAAQAAGLTGQINNLGVNIALANSTAALAQAAGFAGTKDVIQSTSAINLTATNAAAVEALKSAFALQTSILAEGNANRAATEAGTKEVIAAINARAAVEDSRLITTLANEVIELKGDRRLAEATGNITITNTQVQAQAQAQQQQQQQLVLLSQIAQGLNNVTQIAHATNQNIIAGNQGAVTTGAQTASPTNVNTR